jgi:hypothetical protein
MDGEQGRVFKDSDGGVSGVHPEQQTLPVRVAPSTDAEHNTIKAGIIPYACWKVEDMRFEFDSSFIKPEIVDELQHLADLIDEHTEDGQRPPASIFGHADPVGSVPC